MNSHFFCLDEIVPNGIVAANIYINNILKQTLSPVLGAWSAGANSKYFSANVNDNDILRISSNVTAGSNAVNSQVMAFSIV